MDDERYDIHDPEGRQSDDLINKETNAECSEAEPAGDPADSQMYSDDDAHQENTGVYGSDFADFASEPETRKGKRRGHAGRHTNPAATIFTILLTVCVIGSMAYYGQKYWRIFRSPDRLSLKETEEQLSLDVKEKKNIETEDEEVKTRKAMVLDVSDIVAEAMPSVVAITNKSTQEVEYWFRTMEIENESSGSGFIIAKTQEELLIATNAHVVEDAASLSVCFTVDNAGEGAEMETAVAEAVIKGTDTVNDLAVVSVALEDIPEQARDEITVATLGSSEDLVVGEPAIAIGNALGYGQSVTLGIISALNREVTIDDTVSSLIQTDAAINFGNSGGVLLDVEGHVIGISSAKAASYGVEGMGYAIPIDTAKPVLENLMNRVVRKKVDAAQIGYLGISPRDISYEGRSLYNMPEGVFVYEVAAGSPAEKAGIQRGDVITYFDGNSVDSSERLGEQLEYYASGEQVEIVLQRVIGGMYQQQTVTVTLG